MTRERFHADMWRNFNEMKIIFNTLSGKPARFLSRPLVDSNVLRSMEISCFCCASQANSCSIKEAPQQHNTRYLRVLQLALFLGICLEALCNLEMHANPIECNTFNSHQQARQETDQNFLKEHWISFTIPSPICMHGILLYWAWACAVPVETAHGIMLDRHGRSKSIICSIHGPCQVLSRSKDLSLFCHFLHVDSIECLLKCLDFEIWLFCVDDNDTINYFTLCACMLGNKSVGRVVFLFFFFLTFANYTYFWTLNRWAKNRN